MTAINHADAVRLGSAAVDAVHVGGVKVWPPVVGYADRIRSLGPLSYWRLGEAAGASAAVDEMGLYHGAYTGSPTLGVVGLLTDDADTAMQVAGGTMQGVNCGAGYFLGQLTVETWAKTANAGSSYRSVVVKQNAYGIFVIDGVVGTYVWGSGQAVNTGLNINDGQRHHIVNTLQYGVVGGSQFYVDGVAVGAPYQHSHVHGGNYLDIGYNDYAGQEFIGVIDEVAVYGRVLTPDEILGNHQAGVGA
jgi:hypothetical protein